MLLITTFSYDVIMCRLNVAQSRSEATRRITVTSVNLYRNRSRLETELRRNPGQAFPV